jgi:hypothetical protein
VLSSAKVFADDTTLPVLEPGRGKTKTGRLWCYAVDDRPWKGTTSPAAAYIYSEDRKAIHPTAHLAKFRVSRITLSDVLMITECDGLPSSASRPL